MPAKVTVEVKMGIAIPRAPEVIAWIREGMVNVLEAMKRRAQINLSGRFLRVRTGKGLGSLRTTVRTSRDSVTGTIGTPLFYLGILHRGFPAQEMKSTTGKPFTFVRGGRRIETFTISHPGVTARPWFATAVDESGDDVVNEFDAVAEKIARFVQTAPPTEKV